MYLSQWGSLFGVDNIFKHFILVSLIRISSWFLRENKNLSKLQMFLSRRQTLKNWLPHVIPFSVVGIKSIAQPLHINFKILVSFIGVETIRVSIHGQFYLFFFFLSLSRLPPSPLSLWSSCFFKDKVTLALSTVIFSRKLTVPFYCLSQNFSNQGA